MSDHTVVDGSLFLRRRRARSPHGPIYRTLLLDTDVSVCELLHALRHSGLVVSTRDGVNVIHRRPRPDDAA